MGSSDPYGGEKPHRRQYCFADFTLDLEGGFLRRGPEEVRLPPKPFQLLAYLVEHHGRLTTKAALIEALWPDVAITDNSLAQCLLEVRRALGDDSQELIRTVPRRGYVFTAPVTTPILEFVQQRPIGPTEVGSMREPPYAPARKPVYRHMAATLAFTGIVAAGMLLVRLTRPSNQGFTYTQITNFTDSAVAPVLSPDGRMVAFFRSDDWLPSPDQIYLKLLPAGEPVQLTRDPRLKCCLAFSADGLRIAYGTVEPGPSGWKTYTVSVLGGESTLLLSNASGLTWLDQRHLLFSEIRTDSHMGIVTATENRSEYRKIYFPQHVRAMAHFSFASPDRKWALVVEMDPVWQPCRVVPMDGSSNGRQVGPRGKCTSAAWSPDGNWMYFGAEVGGHSHLWRQRFPNGKPEQITFGPTEEGGVAVAPDGRSLITSIGIRQNAIWIHDARGESPLTLEGYVAPMRVFPFSSARFSSDGRQLFYLLRRDSQASASELWRTDLASGRTEAALRNVSIADYDLSSDGKEVVFSTQPDGKASEVWLAPLNLSSAPRLIASTGEVWPQLGADGQVLFQISDGKANYLGRMKRDGSARSKLVPYPIGNIQGMSPDRRWIVVGIPLRDGSTGATMALPVEGGPPRRICIASCPVAWAPDSRYFYVGVAQSSRTSPGKTLAIPLAPQEMLPNLPALGIRGPDDVAAFPGARIINAWQISPGSNPSVFAYIKTTVHRNLFRIPLNE